MTKKPNYTKFKDLDKDHQRLLGRERRLIRMIENRMDKLKPHLTIVNKLRKELEPIEDELEGLKIKIKDIVDENLFTPKITIIRKTLLKKYTYYYGRITFSEKRKDIQIPKRIVEKTKKDIIQINKNRKEVGKEPLFNNEIEEETQLKVRLELWVLDWWMDKGILKKK
jgi:archaellum component FlaC